MVTLLPMDKFIFSFGRMKRVGMDLSIYYGHEFECACGFNHELDDNTELLCQGFWKVMAVCPDRQDHITAIKIRMFLMVKFLGFKSINGARICAEDDLQMVKIMLHYLR